MDESEFVAGAQQLLNSAFFSELEKQLRARSFAKFEHSEAGDSAQRDEAHAELAGLRAVRRECENRISKFKHAERTK